MEDLKKLRSKVVQRKNARLFNKDTDLYYVIKTFKVIFSEKEVEIPNKNGDIIVNLKPDILVLSTLSVFTSEKSIDKGYPATLEEVKIQVSTNTKISEIPDIVYNKLCEKYEDCFIIDI